MKDKLETILREGEAKIAKATTEAELQEVKSSLLGKQSLISSMLKEIPNLDISLRKEIGIATNEIKNRFTEMIETRREEIYLKTSEIPQTYDYTVPGIVPLCGRLHPITQMCYDLNDTFRSMGFEIFQESDITSELYAFDHLNFPPDHPARESMDTYWLAGYENNKAADRLCLRPHLTGASVRYIQTHKPPFRFVYPGRVYRNETTDARHERAFFQYEALIVDKNFTFSAGKIMIKSIL